MNTLTNNPTALTAMISLPDVVKELKDYAERDAIRYQAGHLESNRHPLVTPIRLGRYTLYTPEQVETLRAYFQAKRGNSKM